MYNENKDPNQFKMLPEVEEIIQKSFEDSMLSYDYLKEKVTLEDLSEDRHRLFM